MKTEEIIVANIKCSGCVATIQSELLKLNGVAGAEVFKEKDMVQVSFDGIEREAIIAKLNALGYPEATEKNGLLMQLKSFSSCMTGKIKNLN